MGSPDYVRKAKLYAMYNDILLPVTVDSAGRIIMMPYGTTTVDGEIDVNQTDAVREVQGKDGVTLKTIAVDSAGRIIGVFKGDYLGTLKTIKVDSEGRMIALVTDELDIYGNKVIVGNAELAVRLGSEKFFDRRGDVFLIDNFENGLAQWRTTLWGTGANITLTTDHVRSGGYSVKLTGGSDGYRLAVMENFFPYPILSKWGMEAHISFEDLIDKLDFTFGKFTGSNRVKGCIRYDRVNNRLQYLDSAGNYQNIATSFQLYTHEYLFHVIKLVIDLDSDKYIRLLVDENSYDLSAYDLYSTSTGTLKCLFGGISLYSTAGDNDVGYLDNIIITQNEPD